MGDHQIFLAEMENYKQQTFSLADIELSAIHDQHPNSSGFIPLPLHNQYQLPESFHVDHAHRKRKSCNSPNSSPQLSDDNIANSVERKKKSKKEGKSTDVVHVRAKRGQATDSHSLAERVRREKINERLRCLQDIVPGCYKTMGMAVMLDEIINYVQSLQNQVEFLSMKLTAASAFHDFNSDEDAFEIMQRAKIHNGVTSETASTQFGPLGFNFEYCPQFPHNI